MIELTLGVAEIAARAALAKARALATPITVSVVDEAGRLVMTAKGDGAGFFTPDTSRAKALLAAAFSRATKEMVDEYSKSPAFWASLPGLLPGQVLPSKGGVPIVVQGRVIGAVGCGGGTAEHDHECAATGAEAAAQAMAGGSLAAQNLRFVFFTTNYAASVEFYEKGLELPISGGWDRGPGDKGMMFQIGTATIELICRSGTQSAPPQGAWFSFEVSDVNNLYERLLRKGLPIVEELKERPWGARQFKVRDPNGLILAPYSSP